MNRWPVGALVLCVLIATGCASRRPTQLATPAPQVVQTHYLGSAVSGPQSGALAADAASNAIVVQIHFYATTDVVGAKLQPVGPAARLILDTGEKQPLEAIGGVLSQIRWATSADAEALSSKLDMAPPTQTVKWQDQTLIVPTGVTASVIATDHENHHLLQVLITNPPAKPAAAQCELALGLSEDGGAPEQAVLRPISVTDNVSVAVVIPFKFSDSSAKYAVAIIRAKPASAPLDNDEQELLQQCRDNIATESREAERRMKDRVASQSGNWPGFGAALSSGVDIKSRRAAMVYLASQSGATIARDVFLVADDQTLSSLFDQVTAAAAKVPPGDRSDAAMGWLLDVTTLQFTGKLLSDNQLKDQLAAVMTEYAGEAGRHPASMEQIMKKLQNRQQLETRLVSENKIYLEDSSPAARVRAYDWLKSRGRAPANYDPLGTPKQRREALEQAATQPTTQSTTASSAAVSP